MAAGFRYPPWDNPSLILQGDAHVDKTKNVLLLTRLDTEGNPLPSRAGRAIHSVPVDLGHSPAPLVGFETTFKFRISSSHAPGDGLAFFITESNTEIPADSFGKYLGIFQPPRFVAVVFVTHPHPEDGQPDHPYVGININSVKPSAPAKWIWQDGEIATATVKYIPLQVGNPGTLSVDASYPDGSRVYLEHNVRLDQIFPEKVRVGFSASTEEEYAQKNEVLSWSFGTK